MCVTPNLKSLGVATLDRKHGRHDKKTIVLNDNASKNIGAKSQPKVWKEWKLVPSIDSTFWIQHSRFCNTTSYPTLHLLMVCQFEHSIYLVKKWTKRWCTPTSQSHHFRFFLIYSLGAYTSIVLVWNLIKLRNCVTNFITSISINWRLGQVVYESCDTILLYPSLRTSSLVKIVLLRYTKIYDDNISLRPNLSWICAFLWWRNIDHHTIFFNIPPQRYNQISMNISDVKQGLQSGKGHCPLPYTTLECAMNAMVHAWQSSNCICLSV